MGTVIKGLPVAMFIPATMYDLEIIVPTVEITIPASGKYEDMFPDFSTDKISFNCIDTTVDQYITIDYNTVVEVCFAASKYPRMDSDTFLSVAYCIYDKELNTITLSGSILKFCEPTGDA